MYVAKNIVSVAVNQVSRLSVEKSCEMACVHLPGYNLIVMAVYRSPDSDLASFQETFGRAMDTVLQKFNNKIKIAIAGDFNVDIQKPSTQRTALQSCMSSYGLTGKIWDYTRVQGDSKSTIDNVYTNIDKCTGCRTTNAHYSY